jgi:hypothetical protein
MSRLSSECPETANGVHGHVDTQGKCLFCRQKIDKAMSFGPDSAKRDTERRAQDPLSVDGPDEGDYLDGWGGPA